MTNSSENIFDSDRLAKATDTVESLNNNQLVCTCDDDTVVMDGSYFTADHLESIAYLMRYESMVRVNRVDA